MTLSIAMHVVIAVTMLTLPPNALTEPGGDTLAASVPVERTWGRNGSGRTQAYITGFAGSNWWARRPTVAAWRQQ